jgi:CubicO group peptidase (beta-lactamase class C family)
VADPATGRAVDGDTLFPIFSVGKGVTATIMHRLVERGLLTYDTPVAEIWPEFAAHGKGNIKVRHVLSHMAGLQNLPVGLGPADLNNWRRMCEIMADQTPVSPPGAEISYHGVTFSWLVGETACRAAGKTFEQLIEEEIRRPLGTKDLYIGIPDEVEPRVAVLDAVFEPGELPVVDDTKPQPIPGWLWPLHTWMNKPEVRRACVPASNGIMSARALARHYAALIPGGADGVELLPSERVRLATQRQMPTPPPAPGTTGPQFAALGYWLGGENLDMGTRITAFGHGGYGGAMGFADPEYRLAVGVTKNFISKNGATVNILQRLRKALEIPA